MAIQMFTGRSWDLWGVWCDLLWPWCSSLLGSVWHRAVLSSSHRGYPCCPPLPIPATYTQCKYQNNSTHAQQVSVHRTAAWRLPQFSRACTGGCREPLWATLVELESWMCSQLKPSNVLVLLMLKCVNFITDWLVRLCRKLPTENTDSLHPHLLNGI